MAAKCDQNKTAIYFYNDLAPVDEPLKRVMPSKAHLANSFEPVVFVGKYRAVYSFQFIYIVRAFVGKTRKLKFELSCILCCMKTFNFLHLMLSLLQ